MELAEVFIPAMAGLNGFSHINVLWWSHFVDAPEYRDILQVEQPYRQALSKLGIFATRSPLRPNPIALSVASLSHLDLKNGMLQIPYIDAADGSPILDIKPYHPSIIMTFKSSEAL